MIKVEVNDIGGGHFVVLFTEKPKRVECNNKVLSELSEMVTKV